MQDLARPRRWKPGPALPEALAAALLALAVFGSAAAQERTASEENVKAAYVYNIAKFVDWPPQSFTLTGDVLKIGVLGDDSFASILRATLKDKQVQGHEVAVEQFDGPQELRPCQVLFVSPSQSSGLGQAVRELRRWNTLTIGEDENFIRNGGIINLYLEEQSIRFEIDPDAAAGYGLKISSKLLRLARIVRRSDL